LPYNLFKTNITFFKGILTLLLKDRTICAIDKRFSPHSSNTKSPLDSHFQIFFRLRLGKLDRHGLSSRK